MKLNGPITIFAGAGFSINAGLPVVAQVVPELLDRIKLTGLQRDAVLSRIFQERNLPFELLMETIQYVAPIDTILKIYAKGRPERNHLLIAKLVQQKFVNRIVTTNFDTLFEQALSAIGVPYTVYSSRKDFKLTSTKQGAGIPIYKIHGSIEDIKNLGITLNSIANKTDLEKRKALLKQILTDKKCNQIIFLGYSFSDSFDITPVMGEILGCSKRITVINHLHGSAAPNKKEISRIRQILKGFSNSQILNQNTDLFIESVWKKNLAIPVPKFVKNTTTWRKNIDSWHNQKLKRFEREKILGGRILQRLNFFGESLSIYQNAVKSPALRTSDKANLYNQIGVLLLKKGRTAEALDSLFLALKFRKRVKDKANLSYAYLDIGLAYRRQKDYASALAYMHQALQIANKYNILRCKQNCFTSIGGVYLEQKKYLARGTSYQLRALELAETNGDIVNQIIIAINAASGFSEMKKFKESDRYLEKAKYLLTHFQHTNILADMNFTIGNIFVKNKKFNLALKSYNEAILYSKDKHSLALMHKAIGETWIELKNKKEALIALLKAKPFFKSSTSERKRIDKLIASL